MAPFIVNHPTLLNNWIICRETALKRLELKLSQMIAYYLWSVRNSIRNITSWNTESEFQLKIKNLLKDVKKFLIMLKNLIFKRISF